MCDFSTYRNIEYTLPGDPLYISEGSRNAASYIEDETLMIVSRLRINGVSITDPMITRVVRVFLRRVQKHVSCDIGVCEIWAEESSFDKGGGGLIARRKRLKSVSDGLLHS